MLNRLFYNYFEAFNIGPGPFDVKITALDGSQVIHYNSEPISNYYEITSVQF